MQLTITTLNIQGFSAWDESDTWEKRLPHILNYLQETDSDIICFQEVTFLPEFSAHNTAQVVNKHLNYPFEVSDITRLQEGVVHKVYREGLATIAKLPIAKSDTIVLERAKGDEHHRIIQCIDFLLPNGEILKIANIHFSITDYVDFATPHLQETINILKERGEERIIIGDFNHVALESLESLWGDTYNSTSDMPYITYPVWHDGPKHGPKRVDYALVPKSYSIESISTSQDGLSDHRALTITIKLPN